MSIDDLLNQPLAPLRDDGFAVGVVRRLIAADRRMRITMWSLLAVGTLPVLIVLPFVDVGADVGGALAAQAAGAASSPAISYIAGALVLLWVWKPRFFPR
jgi:hypothetical protein